MFYLWEQFYLKLGQKRTHNESNKFVHIKVFQGGMWEMGNSGTFFTSVALAASTHTWHWKGILVETDWALASERYFRFHCFLTTGILGSEIQVCHFLRTEKEALLISEEF